MKKLKLHKKKPTQLVTKEPKWQPLEPDVAFTDGIPQPEPFSDFLDVYGIHAWTYAAIQKIIQNLAAIELCPYMPVKKADGEIEWIKDEKHEFFPLLQKPNPYMSGYDLRAYTFAGLKLTGNAFWYFETFGTTKLMELWPLYPDSVKPVMTKEKFIDHYEYMVNGQQVKLPYEQVIQFRDTNPSSYIWGQGAISATRNAIMSDIFAQKWNKDFFKNNARPDAVLETEKSLPQPVRQRIIDSWRAAHAGPRNAHKIGILEGGLKYTPLDQTQKDMDFVNMRKELRNEILAAYGVPPAIVGVLEYANYSNMEQQKKTFWMETLLPMLRNVEQTLTLRAEQITFRTGTIFEGETDNVEALRPDMKMLADTVKIFVDSGVPINQVITALDLPFEPIEGGDTPRAPQPASQSPVQPVTASLRGSKSLEPDQKALRETKRLGKWKKYDNRLRKWEDKLEAAGHTYFKSQRKRVLKRLDENKEKILQFTKGTVKDAVEIIFNLADEQKKMFKPYERLIKGTYFDFALEMVDKLNPALDFSLTDPVALEWIQSKTLRLVKEANEYTLEQLTDEIVDVVQEAVTAGYEESETISQIVDRIDSVYEFADESRAIRIARTETAGAANAGNNEALKRAGAEKKEWLSSRDNRTRETHVELDGQVVGVNEKFISPDGASLAFPGDPSGPPEEVINCRCVVTIADDDSD